MKRSWLSNDLLDVIVFQARRKILVNFVAKVRVANRAMCDFPGRVTFHLSDVFLRTISAVDVFPVAKLIPHGLNAFIVFGCTQI